MSFAGDSRSNWGAIGKIIEFIKNETSFFRLHLVAFTFIPLFFSGIFYASNGRFHIHYLDSLFLCYSAMTDTGLTTANLSTLTAWQQTILYLQMMLGDTTTVSWIMVLVRKHYFRTECEHIVASRKRSIKARKLIHPMSISGPILTQPIVIKRPESITNGQTIDGHGHTIHVTKPTPNGTLIDRISFHQGDTRFEEPEERHVTDAHTFSSSPRAISIALPTTSLQQDPTSPISPTSILRQRRILTFNEAMPFPQRSLTILTNLQNDAAAPIDRKYKGFGGFPGPFEILNIILRYLAPSTHRKIRRKLTLPYTTTLEKTLTRSTRSGITVGRNSDLHIEEMTDEELVEIGGTEYQALRLLSYLIPIYFLSVQLFAYILYAPWLSSTTKYDAVFEAQPRLVQKPWFSLFLVTSAYTGTGLTLMDTSMIPFQQAYLIVFGIMFVLLAGNHAQPVFLRFIIWIGSRFTLEGSTAERTLDFLLHHPRRCFLYLFPSHQTWFLLMVLILLSAIEWLAFGVLNTGLESFDSLPVASRVILGLFQGIAVRASGLTIISIGTLAPALQFLYVVLMYIAVYPVAMCIRATNVYEEKSLGVFEPPEGDITEDLDKLEVRERVGKYVGWHLRRQLSIDIWWLVWGIFIVAIVERDNLMNEAKPWFNMFSILFELVSAFGGIGLSLGFPNDNFSLVGAMHPISKLVIIIIMVRGRHRGLPVAVDRAVLQPSELSNAERMKSAQNTGQPDPQHQGFDRFDLDPNDV
ncbi:cation transport protein-domain-containing protein [Collybia nuda]|uniref:Cation transport protein-domain-containing protein n=1 Tax=Collybia nuda TaxID=64659 RepID=A0A9P5XX79_9AGAR|nr:cation transport protein-domain-containing protein [Collybia nuda]